MVARQKFLFLAILFLLVPQVIGQELTDFTTLRAKGDVPQDFITLSSDKFKTDMASNNNDELDKDFFLSSRFFIDELLLSGKMLFNEELTNYLNKVARYTLRTEKKVYKELRFYVLKSTTVNAFSTDQGIIVFTTGLLAQLENEAQLAYIIAHEVSHYTQEHVRDSYVEKRNSRKGNGRYGRLDYEERVSELSVYAKSNEFEADEKGIEIYLKTEYAVDEIFTSFEMLLYSYLPFDEVAFDFDLINTEKLNMPDTFFPDTTNAISLEDEYDDKNSSHPNIKKRIDAAVDIVGDKASRGDLKFKISEDEFNKVQTLARFESINLLLADRRYGRAVYNIFLLKRDHPANRFLDLSFVKALYGLAKYKNANRYREVTERPKNIEGESFPLHLFLYDLSREEINVIALRHAYDMMVNYSGDKIFRMYYEDLKVEMAANSRMDFDDFKDKPFTEHIEDAEEKVIEFDVQDSIQKVDESDLTKYQKIRLKKKLRAIEAGAEQPDLVQEEFYNYALYDLVQTGLIEDLERLKAESELNTKETIRRPSKVAIVDPVYEDYNLKNKRNFEKSERKKIRMSDAYLDSYKKLDLDVEMIDSKSLIKSSVDSYNNIGLVFQWIGEVIEHDGIDMISSMHDQMEPVRKELGTDQFMFTGIFSYKDRNTFSFNHLVWAFTIYGLPFVIADLLIIHNYFDMVSVCINAEEDRVDFAYINQVNMKGTSNVLDAYIFDALYQVKQGYRNNN